MAHDVFISYSTHDKTVADAVCGTLEHRGIRCWIAPRDIPPGKSWPAAIVEAISNSKVFVLVFSNGSNQSRQVFNEVGEAFDNEIPIVPFRIEEVEPSQEMGYFIKTTHWLDAMNPPLERDLNNLAKSIEGFLNAGEIERYPPPISDDVVKENLKKELLHPTWSKWAIGIGAAIILVVALIWLQITESSREPPRVIYPEDADTSRSPENDMGSVLPAESGTTVTPEWSDWKTLSFNIPSETLWRQSGENSYTIIANPSSDTIAWSDEIITGDFILTAEVTHDSRHGAAMFIIYGDGIGFSNGSLIAHYGSTTDGKGWAAFEEHSIYEDGNLLVSNDGDFYLSNEVTTIMIEISDRKANLYADGQKVASAFLPSGMNDAGRIGILQHWEQPVGATYSNIKFKVPSTASVNPDPNSHLITDPTPSLVQSNNAEWGDWSPVTFVIPNDNLWHRNEDGSYTAVNQQDVDTFAWSHEIIDGDFMLNLDVTSEDDYFLAHILAYGDAMGFSDGVLIFLMGDENVIKKHSVYMDEELTFLAGYNADLVDKGQTYNVTIEVIDGEASLFIDDQKVVSATLDDEVNEKGKIGLYKYWNAESVTFANIRIKTKNEGE